MTEEAYAKKLQAWICMKCDSHLSVGKVNVSYRGSTFLVDLFRCPICGQIFIPEELAVGKMAAVEQTLEDK